MDGVHDQHRRKHAAYHYHSTLTYTNIYHAFADQRFHQQVLLFVLTRVGCDGSIYVSRSRLVVGLVYGTSFLDKKTVTIDNTNF